MNLLAKPVALRITDDSQVNVLRHRAYEAHAPHGAPVFVTAVKANVEATGVVKFCNVPQLIVHNILVGHSDGQEWPETAEITGKAKPGVQDLHLLVYANGTIAMRVVPDLNEALQALALA